MELKIIKTGFRTLIYKTRNVLLIVFGLTLMIFLIGESVTTKTSPSGTMLAYVFMTSIATLLFTILLTIVLIYKNVVGTILINGGSISFADGERTISITRLQILLNSDKAELENVRKNTKGTNQILETGHRIISDDLPSEQDNWELVLTKDNKKELLALRDDSIILTPLFDRRPILMESPRKLIDTIAQFGQGWG